MATSTLIKFLAAPIIGILFISAFVIFTSDLVVNYDVELDNSTLDNIYGVQSEFLNFADEISDDAQASVEISRSGLLDIFGSIFGNIVSGIRIIFDSVGIYASLLTSSIPALNLGKFGAVLLTVAFALITLLVLGIFLKYILKV